MDSRLRGFADLRTRGDRDQLTVFVSKRSREPLAWRSALTKIARGFLSRVPYPMPSQSPRYLFNLYLNCCASGAVTWGFHRCNHFPSPSNRSRTPIKLSRERLYKNGVRLLTNLDALENDPHELTIHSRLYNCGCLVRKTLAVWWDHSRSSSSDKRDLRSRV